MAEEQAAKAADSEAPSKPQTAEERITSLEAAVAALMALNLTPEHHKAHTALLPFWNRHKDKVTTD